LFRSVAVLYRQSTTPRYEEHPTSKSKPKPK